jgi:BirA family transcriptional regulator, biotin operon repressor / biotin---[acetyl-CoA-carboxylase] ligase
VAALEAMWGSPFVEAHERIGSTNERASELAREGAPAGTVVVAEEQTEGRGRRGASWESPPGVGLWMSVLVGGQERAAQLPLLVGLACAEGIEAHVAGIRVAIKWPNDLLVGGLKVGGILCEVAENRVVVGFGINVTTPPGGFPETLSGVATSLDEHGAKAVSRSHLAGSILAHLDIILGREAPFPTVLPELERRDALLGRRVETERGGVGLACGIDPSGALVVERSDGSRVRVISGSVRPA